MHKAAQATNVADYVNYRLSENEVAHTRVYNEMKKSNITASINFYIFFILLLCKL